MIRDCRIFKRALTIHEIKESMTSAPNVETDMDLLGWWPMDNGYGTEIVDLSTYGLHGEINAAQWVRDNSGDFIQSTLGKDLNSMFNNKIGSDIRLRASDSGCDPDSFIYAHKIILCSRSEVFKAMLLNDHKEGGSDEIVLQDISNDVLKKLLLFLYTDTVDINGETVLELFCAADKYNLPRLKYMCEVFMQENICLENVCTILEAADSYHANLLRAECIRWILANFGVVLSSPSYLEVSKKLMYEINKEAAKEYFAQKRRKLNDGDALSVVGDIYTTNLLARDKK
eukprot:TRINITY_DN5727_c0_g2_i6.p1 TRINITY_DN5727_c0_g2~~TRINITY_DN5727_c0_g2_i6.p1  ORF type:complete len:286 (-),score=55.05 TRINITY_DN5727_c0_g2_i6:119-976(-)